MKIFLCSDVHLEFHSPASRKAILNSFPEADMVIIAGDFGTINYLREGIKLLSSKYKYVLHVAGNHEYYHSSFNTVNELLNSFDFPNYHFLDNKKIEIEGRVFAGTTMWFRNDPLNKIYEHMFNDFGHIADYKWREGGVYDRNEKATGWLNNNVDNKTIVITHHAPSYQCLAPHYRTDELSRFYVCRMEDLILEKEPRIWISGHSHGVFDFEIGNTRLLSNALGYPNQRTGFSYETINI